MVHRAISDLEDNELQQRVRSVHRFIAARPAHESPDDLRDAITAAYDVSHGNKWLQIIDENGNWLYRSPHVAASYPTLVSPQQAPEAGSYFNYTAESIAVRALIKPINVHGVRYTVQTGLSLSKTLAILSNFRIQLFLLTTLGLLLSSLAGYFMSRKALTPIAAIANEAKRINDKNLNIRLPDLQTRDELAALSNTLNQMLTRIEAGYQSVRSFTANAAHELRSPVALLRAETEVTLAFPRDAAYYRETCERVLHNSVQMTRLIDQLLSLARADAGVEALRFEPVNLPDLLDEVASEWVERFAEVQIQFTWNLGPQELWVEADYIALKRLLNILLENAWRYTPSEKSVTLALGAPTHGKIESLAEISVTDTGIGISPENQSRIFQRFFRIAQPLHGDFTGNGLGLVLAQWIAERHGSAISLQSFPDRGSRFSLSLNSIPIDQKPQWKTIATPSPVDSVGHQNASST
ncbi:MAG: ATP-binding protein [Acidobacteriaceae bacterium]|nr:ATP-binding protein [Acidobacteriaceae bacterium]